MRARRRNQFQPPGNSSILPTTVKLCAYLVIVTGLVSPFMLWYLASPLDPVIAAPNYRGIGAGGVAGAGVAPMNVRGTNVAASVAQNKDAGLPGLSVLILCKDELDSLKASLDTWANGGVLQYADEVLLYFQGRNARKEAAVKPYVDRGLITRVIGDHRLFPIGAAVNWLVDNATQPLVLFLEKDFQLVEPAAAVVPRLDGGRRMISTGEADVVRYRSRLQAGEPNYAEGMYKGREHVILQRQPNLYCSVHYWLPDAELDAAPHSRYIHRCPATTSYYCTKAKFCNWTNNPQMFKRAWYMKRFYEKVNGILKLRPPDNDLEFFMNWNFPVWNDADITVAMGEGLFTHKEIGEHAPLNFAALRGNDAEEVDKYQDCDIGRRFTKEQCLDHHCLWKPGHPIATCIGENGRLEDCGAEDQASCEAIPRCFWNPWTVWLPSKCVRDKVPHKSWQGA